MDYLNIFDICTKKISNKLFNLKITENIQNNLNITSKIMIQIYYGWVQTKFEFFKAISLLRNFEIKLKRNQTELTHMSITACL